MLIKVLMAGPDPHPLNDTLGYGPGISIFRMFHVQPSWRTSGLLEERKLYSGQTAEATVMAEQAWKVPPLKYTTATYTLVI